MSINRGITVDAQLVANASASVYATPTDVTRAVITSAVSYANAAVTNAQFFILASGASASDTNLVKQKSFAADESYTHPELVGQAVESGGSIQANDGAGGGAVLNIVITVTEFTGDS